jgi:hypothetical protein
VNLGDRLRASTTARPARSLFRLLRHSYLIQWLAGPNRARLLSQTIPTINVITKKTRRLSGGYIGGIRLVVSLRFAAPEEDILELVELLPAAVGRELCLVGPARRVVHFVAVSGAAQDPLEAIQRRIRKLRKGEKI